MVEEHTLVVTVRAASRLELVEVFRLGEPFLRETGWAGAIIPDVAARSWAEMIDAGQAEIFVLVQGNSILGGLGCFAYQDLYDGALLAQEGFWYVRPEARRGTAAMRLLRAFEAWGEQFPAQRYLLSHFDSCHEQLTDLFDRLGYRPAPGRQILYYKPA